MIRLDNWDVDELDNDIDNEDDLMQPVTEPASVPVSCVCACVRACLGGGDSGAETTEHQMQLTINLLHSRPVYELTSLKE